MTSIRGLARSKVHLKKLEGKRGAQGGLMFNKAGTWRLSTSPDGSSRDILFDRRERTAYQGRGRGQVLRVPVLNPRSFEQTDA